jgi:hypothetical protein
MGMGMAGGVLWDGDGRSPMLILGEPEAGRS